MMQTIRELIKQALQEDIGAGDITTKATIPIEQIGEAKCYVKENCIIAGVELARMICNEVDPSLIIDFTVKDGDAIKAINCIGNIKGSLHSILKAERLLLNWMQRMSGIATKTNYFVEVANKQQVKILDTRKTTPNCRIIEKWAVKIGGGHNHRFGLYDEVLIKDNHIKASGGIAKAIKACEHYFFVNKINIPVVVEVKNAAEFIIAKQSEIVTRILIDNFKQENIYEIIELNNGVKKIEVSGNINETNIKEYAQSGIDYISIGSLTHHIKSIDISLKIL